MTIITRNNLSPSDKRHLRLMKQFIVDYREEKKSLSEFLSDILVYDCLDSVSNDWKQNFFNQWAELEQIYAGVLCDFQSGKLQGYDFRSDEEAITILRNMENLLGIVEPEESEWNEQEFWSKFGY